MIAALSDTTVLSNFTHVQRSDLLRMLFHPLYVPDSVWRELAQGMRSGLIPEADWRWLEVVVLTPDEVTLSQNFRRKLDRGEADCLAVAQSRRLPVYTDDRRARSIGRSLGLGISGTLGCLLDLVERSLLNSEEADLLLTRMREQGYRSPVASLRDAEL
jgi:predicted nucleic acid-binding protein